MAEYSYVEQAEAAGAVLELVGEAGGRAARASEGLAQAVEDAAKAAADMARALSPQVYTQAADAAEKARRGLAEWGRFQSGLAGLVKSFSTASADAEDMVRAMRDVQAGAVSAAEALNTVREYVQSQADLVGGWSGFSRSVGDYALEYGRRDWGREEYDAEYERLAAEIRGLDENAEDYYEQQLDLLADQFEVLKRLDSLESQALEEQRRLRDSFDGAFGTLDSAVSSLLSGQYAPVQSPAVYTERFEDLLLKAMADPDAVGELVSFVQGDFLRFFSAYGSGGEAFDTALAALTALRDAYGDLGSGSLPDFSGLSASLSEVGEALDYLSGSAGYATGASASLASTLAGQGVAGMQALADQAGATAGAALQTAGSTGELQGRLTQASGGFESVGNLIQYMVDQANSGFQAVSSTFASLVATLQSVASGDASDATVDPGGGGSVPAPAYIMEEHYDWEDLTGLGGDSFRGDFTGKSYDYRWDYLYGDDMRYVPGTYSYEGRYLYRKWSDGRIEYLAEGGILDKAAMVRPGVVAGEAGPEAVVPLTAQGVEVFTRGLGLNPEEFGRAVAERLAPMLAEAVGSGGGEVRIDLNGRGIARTVGRELAYDGEFVSSMRRVM